MVIALLGVARSFRHHAARLRAVPPLLAFLVPLLAGCAGKRIPAVEISSKPFVEMQRVAVGCDVDTSFVMAVPEIKFPVCPQGVAVDSSGAWLGALWLEPGGGGRQEFASVSMASGEATGCLIVPSSASILGIRKGIGLIQLPGRVLRVQMATGDTLGSVPGWALPALAGSQFVCLSGNGKVVSGYQWGTGAVAWQRERSAGNGLLNGTWREGQKYMLLGTHLWTGSVPNGAGWEREVGTSSANYTKVLAKNCLLGVLSALAPTPMPTTYGTDNPDITSGLFSNPLVVGDRVLFVSKKHLLAFDAANGKDLWSIDLDGRDGTCALFRLDEDRCVVVAFGRQLYNGVWRDNDNSYAACFSVETGEELWSFRPDQSDRIVQALATPGRLAVCTDSLVHVIDRNGALLSESVPAFTTRYRGADTPWRMLASGNTLLMCISGGNARATAWNLEDLSLLGDVDVELGTVVSTEAVSVTAAHIYKGTAPVVPFPMQDPDHIWSVPSTGDGIVAVDRRSARVVRSIRYSHVQTMVGPGHVLLQNEDRVAVFPLASLAEGMPVP